MRGAARSFTSQYLYRPIPIFATVLAIVISYRGQRALMGMKGEKA